MRRNHVKVQKLEERRAIEAQDQNLGGEKPARKPAGTRRVAKKVAAPAKNNDHGTE